MIQVAILACVVVALGVFGLLRPWAALTLLLALMPFNGFLVDVVAVRLGLSGAPRIVLASWHDAIVLGFLVAAGLSWLTSLERRITALEIGAAMLFMAGFISLITAPHLLTAAYSYRDLYEPVLLGIAVVALARIRRPELGIRRRAAFAIVGGAVLASVLAWWQVYVAGTGYLDQYFRVNGVLPTAYMAAGIAQPRAFSTFHSPNEFGAFLVIALGLLAVPGVVEARLSRRAWAAAVLASAILLTLSRSAWLGTAVVLALAWLLRPQRSLRLHRLISLERPRATLRDWAPPLVALVFTSAVVVATSGAYQFVSATVSGHEPSSASRVETVQTAISDIFGPVSSPGPTSSVSPGAAPAPTPVPSRPRIGLFGLGLGAAGPLSSRFGEVGTEAWVTSEMWYVDYLLQTGVVGLATLAIFAGLVALRLWRGRPGGWPVAALSIAAGLALGALFIPIIDQPAVAIPLWTVIGLAIATADSSWLETPVRSTGAHTRSAG